MQGEHGGEAAGERCNEGMVEERGARKVFGGAGRRRDARRTWGARGQERGARRAWGDGAVES